MNWLKGAQVKFNDKHDKWENFTHGEIYEIFQVTDEGKIIVAKDDRGLKNWHWKKYFELVTEEKQVKTKIPHIKTKNSITLIYGGKTQIVAKQDDRFELVLAALREGRDEEIPEIIDPSIGLTRAGLKVEEGIVTLNGEAMPQELNSRILEYKKEGLPFNSLTNFWRNLQENPSFNSRQQLFKFLENKGHPITEDGYFLGYRGVAEDFKDIHSGTFDNRPGQRCEMPRTAVDDNPNNTCSHGLHVGGYDYAKDFGRGRKLVVVKVNPKDVVSVPNDYNGQKMRVCAFEVLSEASGIIEVPVVNEKGGLELKRDELAPSKTGEVLTGESLKAFEESEHYSRVEKQAATLDPEQIFKIRKKAERAHKKRYANNHAKRGKDGKFITKKKRGK